GFVGDLFVIIASYMEVSITSNLRRKLMSLRSELNLYSSASFTARRRGKRHDSSGRTYYTKRMKPHYTRRSYYAHDYDRFNDDTIVYTYAGGTSHGGGCLDGGLDCSGGGGCDSG
ncbi:13461_t:CDS:2, partial [Acaulospora colombiana]